MNECIFKGGLASCTIDFRIIFKRLLIAGVTCFICIHNHPTGFCSESKDDILTTKRLNMIGNFIGIELLDHIIIGSGGQFNSLHSNAAYAFECNIKL